MRRLFITDLDHTFLRSDQSISEFSRDTISELTKNHLFTVATARSFHKVGEFLGSLKPNAPMILLDGTMIATNDKKIIDLKLISQEISDEIVSEAIKFGIYPFIIGLEDVGMEELFWYPTILNVYQKEVLQNYKNDPRLALKEPMRAMKRVLKVVFFGTHEILKPLTDHLKSIFGDALEYKLSPENYGGGWFLTLLHPHGDKSHAIITVANYLGYEVGDITVFGDSVNDIGMFELCGTSMAVSNALDGLKTHASEVLPHSNDEDAVAKYLTRFL